MIVEYLVLGGRGVIDVYPDGGLNPWPSCGDASYSFWLVPNTFEV